MNEEDDLHRQQDLLCGSSSPLLHFQLVRVVRPT